MLPSRRGIRNLNTEEQIVRAPSARRHQTKRLFALSFKVNVRKGDRISGTIGLESEILELEDNTTSY